MVVREKVKENIQKRYIFLGIIVILVVVLIWRVGSSFAYVNQGYEGRNIVSGNKWGVNITEISEVTLSGKAELIHDVSTIGTTLNFDVVLFEPGDKVSFNIETQNTSTLSAELYALTLSGLSKADSEYITYTILPIDSSTLHEENVEGSIIKSGEKQMFKIEVSFDETARISKEFNLSLGSTIIYKQK